MKVEPMNGIFYSTFSALGIYNQTPLIAPFNPVERARESVPIIGVSVLGGLNVTKMYGAFSRDKANCPYNNEVNNVSVLGGCP